MWLLQTVYFIKRELSTGSMGCLSEGVKFFKQWLGIRDNTMGLQIMDDGGRQST